MPPPADVHGGGSTRRTPTWLLALAGLLLALRIATGVYEASTGRIAPVEGPVIEIQR